MLSALRAGTAPLHQQLEAQLDLDRCLRSRGHYAAMLGAMLGGFAPLEAALAGFDWQALGLGRNVVGWRPARLEADLAALGESPARIRALPRCVALPRFETRDQAFGGLYVLEGSVLGGQVVLRRAAAALGVSAESGASFHAGLGRPPAGESWRAFRAALEAHCADAPAATEAAAATFAALADWMPRCLPVEADAA
ncbi:biliverdin-producing heme oxygenase [Roseomonas sp. BN140053]|uniref:biliverdin-producing heme oxygenase n=1 Tax=Roseomonas sp. BN140053 TaxID=3391898 RepID=UPI0039E95E93